MVEKKIKHYYVGDYIWAISHAVYGNIPGADLYPFSIKNDTLHLVKLGIGSGEYLLRIKEGD